MSNGPRVSQGERLPSVLVVEDDFVVRAVAVAHLEESGFSIVEAQTADEAMVILRDDRSIAAVFSDVQMPGSMDGIALAQWLARMSQGQGAFDLGKDGPGQIIGMALYRKALFAGGNGAGVAQSPRRSSGKLGLRSIRSATAMVHWPFPHARKDACPQILAATPAMMSKQFNGSTLLRRSSISCVELRVWASPPSPGMTEQGGSPAQ